MSSDKFLGKSIDRYFINKSLGKGGFGHVYHATGDNIDFAIKIFEISPSTLNNNGLSKEAMLAAEIKHKSVVKIFHTFTFKLEDEGNQEEYTAIVMELASHGNCRKNPSFLNRLEISDYCSIINLLDGLNHIHKKNIIHGDIKPSNILRFKGRDLGRDVLELKITDFGISCNIPKNNQPRQPYGFSREFASPEHYENRIDFRSDIFCMGATLFFMLTGQCPFSLGARNIDNTMEQNIAWRELHKTIATPKISEYRTSFDPVLSFIIFKMMNPEPEKRPSLEECIKDVRRIIDHLSAHNYSQVVGDNFKELLKSTDFPIWYTPKMKGVFKPEVYQSLGLNHYTFLIHRLHMNFDQLLLVVENCYSYFKDSFNLYETWGKDNLILNVWCDESQAQAFLIYFLRENPDSQVTTLKSNKTTCLISKWDERKSSYSIEDILSVQYSFSDNTDLFCTKLPKKLTENSIRAFTFVQKKQSPEQLSNLSSLYEAIRSNIPYLNRLFIHETSENKNASLFKYSSKQSKSEYLLNFERSTFYSGTILLIEFVAKSYRELFRLPSIINEEFENLQTFSLLETRRLSIQSGKVLIDPKRSYEKKPAHHRHTRSQYSSTIKL